VPLSGAPVILRAHIRSAIRSDWAVLWPEHVWRSCAVGSLDVKTSVWTVFSGVDRLAFAEANGRTGHFGRTKRGQLLRKEPVAKVPRLDQDKAVGCTRKETILTRSAVWARRGVGGRGRWARAVPMGVPDPGPAFAPGFGTGRGDNLV